MIWNFTTMKTSSWKGRGKTSVSKMSTNSAIRQSNVENMVKFSKRWITALMPSVHEDKTTAEIFLYRYARRVRIGKTSRQIGKPPPHDCISFNNAVQIHLDPGTLETIILKSSPSFPCCTYSLCSLFCKEKMIFRLQLGSGVSKEGKLYAEKIKMGLSSY